MRLSTFVGPTDRPDVVEGTKDWDLDRQWETSFPQEAKKVSFISATFFLPTFLAFFYNGRK